MGDRFSVWKRHFENQARGLIPHDNAFYKVSSDSKKRGEGDSESKVSLVSPTQQVVERAKNQIKYHDTIYDPVTGIMLHSTGKPRSVRRLPQSSRQKKKKVSKKNNSKRKAKSKKKKCQKKKKGDCKKKKDCS